MSLRCLSIMVFLVASWDEVKYEVSGVVDTAIAGVEAWQRIDLGTLGAF